MLQRFYYHIMQAMSQALFVVLYHGRAYHRHRVPARGGVLVVSNHQSYLDPILAAIPILRPFNPMARDTLFRNPLFAALIRSLYAFPVKRGSADLGAIREAIRRLKRGEMVLVFPEGTRTRDGSIGKLHAGIIVIAQRAAVPVLPMVIDGAYRAWPKGRLWPTACQVKIGYGAPIAAERVAKMEPEELVDEIRRQMLEIQQELRQESRQESQHEGAVADER